MSQLKTYQKQQMRKWTRINKIKKIFNKHFEKANKYLKEYISNLNFPYKGDFKIDSYKEEMVEIYGEKSKKIVVKTIDIDGSIVSHIISLRDFNLLILNISR